MPAPDIVEMLCGRWRHAGEEDTADLMVFRPASYAFQSARGRLGFDLRADGSATWLEIGRDDRAVETSAAWRVDAGPPAKLFITASDGGRETLLIERVETDRLMIRKH